MDAPVMSLRSNIATRLQAESSVIDLLYAGKKLDDEEVLAAYDIKTGVTVHVVDKVVRTSNDCNSPKKVSVGSIKGIVSSSHYKTIVEKLVSNSDSLKKLFSIAPELENDHIALSILQEPELLQVLVEQRLIDKLIAEHPGVGKALMHIGAAVTEKAADMSPRGQRMQYSLDQMSDEEDMDSANLQESAPQPITAGQLGAALANLSNPRGDSSSSGSGASTSGHQAITPDFFRQAIAAAGSGNSQQGQSPVSENDLQQLREMGITDERVARRALEATGGNIQAALELIFGDGF